MVEGNEARLLVGVLAGSFFLFLGIPLAALIIREPPAMLWQAIQRPESIEALQLSLITTTISTLLALVFGLPVAYILARLHFPGRNLLETLAMVVANAKVSGYLRRNPEAWGTIS